MATRAPKSMVKNKAPAPIQITAEQLMREAMERVEAEPKKPRQKITNGEELAEYRMRKRKDFEDALRRQRHSISTWLRYASWEATQKEFDRARSVFERALEVEYQNTGIWLKYAETEMKNKFVNHARNVWDRAVSLLPRVDQFWLKFAYMEEMLGNIDGARVIFERWMQWQPDNAAWNSYVKFELRQGDVERARNIFERWLVVHNEVATYMKYAKFEEKHGQKEKARVVFERATVDLGDDLTEDLIIAFAQFEERCKEFERAGLIYRHALDNLPKHKAKEVYQQYIQFEKQHGSKDGVENVILSKRRFQYEEELKDNPHNYDVWFDYIRLEEAAGDVEKIREIYERAVANVPPLQEKRYWKRYIYLWINYALYEEMVAKDFDRARAVYAECIKLVPHQHFTFAKIWVLAAHFEIRRKDLDAARRILGTAIGKAPKEKIFKAYIDLEASLSEVDRCRILYQKYVEFMPTNCYAWTKFAEFEKSLEEYDRVRCIFDLATKQRLLDMPEVVWKAYIDFEISQNQTANVRELYTRLIRMSTSAKPWISSAQFEASISEFDRARNIFSDANQVFKERENKEDRVLLLEAWRDFESIYGTKATLAEVAKKMPKRVKKKKLIKGEDGAEAGWEEYYDFIFPDEEAKTSTLAILEAARKWKKQKSLAEQQQEARENAEAAAAAEVAEAAGVTDMDADEDA